MLRVAIFERPPGQQQQQEAPSCHFHGNPLPLLITPIWSPSWCLLLLKNFILLCSPLMRRIVATVDHNFSACGADLHILTWLALGKDHAACSRRVEQLIALRGL